MTSSPLFDEMWGHDETLRDPYRGFCSWFDQEDPARLRAKQREAEDLFRLTGITFNVYGRAEAEERLIPFDIIPRIISGSEWYRLSRGIEQRVRAINAFLHDIYHKQEIIKAGRLPEEMVAKNDAFLPQMIGVEPPGGVYTHIVGIDLVRTGPGRVLRARGQCPHALGRQLHAGEPRDDAADVPGALLAEPGARGPELPGRPAPLAGDQRAPPRQRVSRSWRC